MGSGHYGKPSIAPRRLNRNGFSAESVKSQAVRDYAFPQTRLWKSGPDGAVSPRQRNATKQLAPFASVATRSDVRGNLWWSAS